MCAEAVWIEPLLFKFVLNHFKTQNMRDEAVRIKLYSLKVFLSGFKTQEIWDKAVRLKPYLLEFVPDHLSN